MSGPLGSLCVVNAQEGDAVEQVMIVARDQKDRTSLWQSIESSNFALETPGGEGAGNQAHREPCRVLGNVFSQHYDQVSAPENHAKLAMLTRRLPNEADRYYRSGDAGLWHLSFRSACAVSAARHVYSEIGSLLVKRGERAWDRRTYVTGARKFGLFSALYRVSCARCRRGCPSPGHRGR